MDCIVHGVAKSQTRLSDFTSTFTCGSAGKESACNAEDRGSIPGLGRSPGEGKGYPLRYSGLENSMDCIVNGVTKSQTQLSDFHFHFLSHCLCEIHLCCESEVKVKVAQLCLTFYDPIDYTVHGILQARIPEWVAFLFSSRSSQQGLNPGLPHCRRILYQLSHKGNLSMLW